MHIYRYNWQKLWGGDIDISVPPTPNFGGDVYPPSPPGSTPMVAGMGRVWEWKLKNNQHILRICETTQQLTEIAHHSEKQRHVTFVYCNITYHSCRLVTCNFVTKWVMGERYNDSTVRFVFRCACFLSHSLLLGVTANNKTAPAVLPWSLSPSPQTPLCSTFNASPLPR